MFVLIPVDVLIAIHSEKIGQKRNR
ncbi:hypothetical protein Mc24_00425 [Thermotoga sp. Mc24]|nr:hypothetical protein T2812B_03035 [Thermotoga sp. 2812B]EJX26090.1 hypothetical protein EMP_03670 [Thermotoga sp. EMP]KHC93993.1 hypothetical protein Mc24_00425 [Thermotoga sp. Mc24]